MSSEIIEQSPSEQWRFVLFWSFVLCSPVLIAFTAYLVWPTWDKWAVAEVKRSQVMLEKNQRDEALQIFEGVLAQHEASAKHNYYGTQAVQDAESEIARIEEEIAAEEEADRMAERSRQEAIAAEQRRQEEERKENEERRGLGGQRKTPIRSRAFPSWIREFAAREYPNDSRMQKYTYDQQLSAKRYMSTVTDPEVKQIALWEYPSDYSMQKYTYDQQLSAKRYMSTVTDREVKQIALREYQSDYSMQKYTYDQQLSAKQYMNAQGSSSAKSQAQREYPNDYSMQKYTYDQNLIGR